MINRISFISHHHHHHRHHQRSDYLWCIRDLWFFELGRKYSSRTKASNEKKSILSCISSEYLWPVIDTQEMSGNLIGFYDRPLKVLDKMRICIFLPLSRRIIRIHRHVSRPDNETQLNSTPWNAVVILECIRLKGSLTRPTAEDRTGIKTKCAKNS